MKMWVRAEDPSDQRYYVNDWARLVEMQITINGVWVTQTEALRIFGTKVWVNPEDGIHAWPGGHSISAWDIVQSVTAAVEALPDPYESESL